MEQRPHHDVDCDRGNVDVRDRLHPGCVAELPRRVRVSAHPGDRQTDLIQAERGADRTGAGGGLRALYSGIADASLAGCSDDPGGSATALVSAGGAFIRHVPAREGGRERKCARMGATHLRHGPPWLLQAAYAVIVAAAALLWLPSGLAHAQSTLRAHYRLSLAGIGIGQGDWSV